jgi:hypothetical protein
MPGAPTVRKPVKSVALAASTPRPLKPSNAAQTKEWNKGSGGTALSAVTRDSGTVLMAHATGQYTQMLQACRALDTAIKDAEALSPIPDAAMQRMYTKSLSAFSTGVADCEAGISQHAEGVEDTVTHVNQADIKQAITEFSVGTTDLYRATEVLRKQ